MSDESWWPAPAKLNLFLHITGRRADGYHDLQTAFVLLELHDRIGLSVRADGAIQRPRGLQDVSAEQDLTVRAARLLQQRTRAAAGVDIQVVKNIPVGGGLGGGSSDAATVLLALNVLWNTRLTLSELAELGGTLGADVPVFVRGHSAWAEGRGDQLQPLSLPPRWFLVVHPGVSVSTAEIFQAPELTRNSPIITIRAFSQGRAVNVCEPVVFARYPAVAEASQWLGAQSDLRGAPLHARMSGTGACLFVDFDNAADAERIAARVPDRWRSFVARGLDRSPLHRMLGVQD